MTESPPTPEQGRKPPAGPQAQGPADPYDPQVARRNRRVGLAVLGVVLLVLLVTYVQRGALTHVLFKVG